MLQECGVWRSGRVNRVGEVLQPRAGKLCLVCVRFTYMSALGMDRKDPMVQLTRMVPKDPMVQLFEPETNGSISIWDQD